MFKLYLCYYFQNLDEVRTSCSSITGVIIFRIWRKQGHRVSILVVFLFSESGGSMITVFKHYWCYNFQNLYGARSSCLSFTSVIIFRIYMKLGHRVQALLVLLFSESGGSKGTEF